MKFHYRLAIYILATVIIEVPAIFALYSYGYPSNSSSYGTLAFYIAYNILFILIAFGSIGGPVPGAGPRDMSMDLFWGVVLMFVILAVIGETLEWLFDEIMKLKGRQKLQSQ
jgi:hypothetical protein